MMPWDYIEAARVPRSLTPQQFGLWTIQRLPADGAITGPKEMAMMRAMVGFNDYTLLRRVTDRNIHLETAGEIVMEDSARELMRHLPIWLRARGRVLVTGLGLGCVVRGLLAKPDVDFIDVIEIDRGIVKVIGPEFADSSRVKIHHGDAMKINLPGRYDFAWHDLWVDDAADMPLQVLHLHLMHRYRDRCGPQGAWAFPRLVAKMIRRHGFELLGAPR